MPKLTRIENTDITLKANVYFDGKVVSHTIEDKDGSRQTIGMIYPGTYNFNTGVSERMDIIAGSCKVRVKGQNEWTAYNEGSYFEVPGKSSFDIAVEKGITEYLCSYGK
jgi:uncharacterized protein YaiE (UPF0345 family)